MDDILRQVVAALRSMWKYRWLGLAVGWIVGVGAVGFVMRVPDQFEASARIFVDTQSMLKPLMSGLAVQPNVEQQVMMLSRTLISRPNVEKLIRMADLDLDAKTKGGQDALVDSLIKTLAIRSTSRDNLYTLSYRSQNPEQAKRVVQSLVSIFVESSLGDKRKDSDSAKRFIEDQIKAYEKKLEEAEGRLKEFKIRNIDLQSADGKTGVDRLPEIMKLLSNARLELREAENSRDALKLMLSGDFPSLVPDAPGADVGIATPELDSRIDALKRNLDTLLQRYTEAHPDVMSSRRLIRDLEEQKKQEIAARKKLIAANPVAPPPQVNNNPAYQQLKVSLGESEANIASLKVRVAEYENRLKSARESLRLAPQLEAELAQLNRDYGVHKKNYDDLVSRRESAALSTDLESAAGVADFRLIDPPRVSPKPVAPNRMLLMGVVTAASLLAGLAAAFLASMLRPVFIDSRSLRDFTGLPVLGSVSRVAVEHLNIQERGSLRRFLLAFVGLLAFFAVGFAVNWLKSGMSF